MDGRTTCRRSSGASSARCRPRLRARARAADGARARPRAPIPGSRAIVEAPARHGARSICAGRCSAKCARRRSCRCAASTPRRSARVLQLFDAARRRARHRVPRRRRVARAACCPWSSHAGRRAGRRQPRPPGARLLSRVCVLGCLRSSLGADPRRRGPGRPHSRGAVRERQRDEPQPHWLGRSVGACCSPTSCNARGARRDHAATNACARSSSCTCRRRRRSAAPP